MSLKVELQKLYGEILNICKNFPTKNIREYFTRRTIEEFQEFQKKLSMETETSHNILQNSFLKKMNDYYGMLQRQSIINHMYHQPFVNVKR
jgi:hypothetical protein